MCHTTPETSCTSCNTYTIVQLQELQASITAAALAEKPGYAAAARNARADY